jgi:hypothetical protein
MSNAKIVSLIDAQAKASRMEVIQSLHDLEIMLLDNITGVRLEHGELVARIDQLREDVDKLMQTKS